LRQWKGKTSVMFSYWFLPVSTTILPP